MSVRDSKAPRRTISALTEAYPFVLARFVTVGGCRCVRLGVFVEVDSVIDTPALRRDKPRLCGVWPQAIDDWINQPRQARVIDHALKSRKVAERDGRVV